MIINSNFFKKTFIISCFSTFLLNSHLKTMKSKERPHLGIMLLIDQSLTEKPENPTIEVITKELRDSIELCDFPILATYGPIKNFIERKIDSEKPSPTNEKNIILKDISFSQNDWGVFHYKDTQFFLLAPYKKLDLIKKAFKNLDKMKSIFEQEQKETEIKDLTLIKALKKYIEKKEEDMALSKVKVSDFEQLFKTYEIQRGAKKQVNREEEQAQARLQYISETPIIDIISAGHGKRGKSIINLPINTLQKLIEFFKYRIDIGFWYLSSCYIKLEDIQFYTELKNKNVLQTLNYIIISTGIDATVTFYKKLNYKRIFKKFSEFDKGKSSIEDIIKELWSPLHRYTNIPQVFFPRGMGFQYINVEERIKNIGNVLLRVLQEEEKTIDLIGYNIVLNHPQSINIPIGVFPTAYPSDNLLTSFNKLYEKHWDKYPSFLDYFTRNKERLVTPPLFDRISNLKMYRDLGNLYNHWKEDKNYYNYIYPFFINMKRENYIQHFSHIVVYNGISPTSSIRSSGIHKFIRDAFYDPFYKAKDVHFSKTFLIDRVIGLNDLYLFLKTHRTLKSAINNKKTEPSDLEKILSKPEHRVLKIENVKIELYSDPESLEKTFSIRFDLEGESWELLFDDREKDDIEDVVKISKLKDHKKQYQLEKFTIFDDEKNRIKIAKQPIPFRHLIFFIFIDKNKFKEDLEQNLLLPINKICSSAYERIDDLYATWQISKNAGIEIAAEYDSTKFSESKKLLVQDPVDFILCNIKDSDFGDLDTFEDQGIYKNIAEKLKTKLKIIEGLIKKPLLPYEKSEKNIKDVIEEIHKDFEESILPKNFIKITYFDLLEKITDVNWEIFFKIKEMSKNFILIEQAVEKYDYIMRTFITYLYQIIFDYTALEDPYKIYIKKFNTFLIDKMFGQNDLPFLIKRLREYKGDNKVTKLENLIGKEKDITIEKTITQVRVYANKINFDLNFIVKNTAWRLFISWGESKASSRYELLSFELQQLDLKDHEENYNENFDILLKRQKTITQILEKKKKKIEQMKRKEKK